MDAGVVVVNFAAGDRPVGVTGEDAVAQIAIDPRPIERAAAPTDAGGVVPTGNIVDQTIERATRHIEAGGVVVRGFVEILAGAVQFETSGVIVSEIIVTMTNQRRGVVIEVKAEVIIE